MILLLPKPLLALIALLMALLGYHVVPYTPYPSPCLPSQAGQLYTVTGDGAPFLAVCITDTYHHYYLNALS